MTFLLACNRARSQPHRRLADIVKLIEAAGLSAAVKARSIAVFDKLAAAEAKVHGTAKDEIHFHEVGGVDAIIDIVGAVFGLEALGIEKVYADSLRTGFGFTQCAHGRLPVPAPATAELLNGIPYTHGDIEKELLTPTGAALLAALCDGFGEIPAGFTGQSVAYGAGGWELDIPNVLRARIGTLQADDKDGLLVFETNIDDASPQLFGYVMERLFKAGALDVWLTPVQMKKNRPAVKLSALAPAALRGEVENIIFTETTTLGIRNYAVRRTAAERREAAADTPWGRVRIKISSVNGKVCSVTPEYEDCRRLAAESGTPLKDVMAAARGAPQAR
ncbi:MAG: nickel pincer cofactor biosynthesis protein LarC [Elusimicrobia bacterium]|nr:nickel pincer cofactor biosynthesis protein LarC [Elusimicrobiota bacterium]